MNTMFWFGLVFAIGFMVVHFSAKYMKLSTSNPRSPLLSLAGGATIAYVFLYLLPELEKYLEPIKEAAENSWLGFFGDYTYLLALLGLLVYYGLDIMMKTKKEQRSESGKESFSGVFLLHLSSFFLYNMIIGYLLVREEFTSVWGMSVYFLALAAHFIATDHSLKKIHKSDYDKYGRWFLIGAILVGWLIGVILTVHEVAVGIAVSTLAGGILYNVFKDELPEGRLKNYGAFACGVVVIVVLLLLVEG